MTLFENMVEMFGLIFALFHFQTWTFYLSTVHISFSFLHPHISTISFILHGGNKKSGLISAGPTNAV